MRKFSIGSWAFRSDRDDAGFDFHTIVHKLQHLGFDGVELSCKAPHPTPDSLPSKELRQKFRRLVTSHGLEFSALMVDFTGTALTGSPDATAYLAVFDKHLTFAEDLGIRVIRVDTAEPTAMLERKGLDPRLMVDRVVAGFAECSRRAAQRGITVAWEFDAELPLHQSAEVAQVVQQVRDDRGHANFGILFDTRQASLCAGPGDVPAFLRKLRGKIVHLHLSHGDGGTSQPLGTGALDFSTILPELAECAADVEWWCIDIAVESNVWTAAAESKRYLGRQLKRLSL
jgi:sugar phosphate isomerase/epimerase